MRPAAALSWPPHDCPRPNRTVADRLPPCGGGPDRSVQLDEGFDIRVLESNGHSCAPRQLSQGARDQLVLALRLAVAELLSSHRLVPLLFDDPFLSFDPDRLAAMRETLEHLAAERQIFVLSHREELAAWGTRVEIER